MANEFKFVRTVEFSETDMAGIVHFSNFCKYMESAEHRFFRSIGFSIVTSELDLPIGWSRVHTSFNFKKPLRFEDEIEIHLLVAEIRSKAITYQFRFNKLNGNECELAATGKLTVVCVFWSDDGTMKACDIPKEIASKMEVAPAEMLVS